MMKKRIAALALACAMSLSLAIPAMSVEAKSVWENSKIDEFRYTDANNNPQYDSKKTTDYVFELTSAVPNATELKPSGISDVKVSVVSGASKDNLIDNGVKPLIKEFVKATNDMLSTKVGNGTKYPFGFIEAIYYGSISASQPGNVTFKIEDKIDLTTNGDDPYAIVLHYTGNAADEDGITAQYCKISSAGKVTAHFNTFGPFAIVATTATNAQVLANTYSHSVGTDAASLTPATTTTTTVAAPVSSTATAAAPVATTTTAAPAATTATTTNQGIQTTTAQPITNTAGASTVAAPVATTTTAAPAAATQATTATTAVTSSGVQTTTPSTISSANQPIMVVR